MLIDSSKMVTLLYMTEQEIKDFMEKWGLKPTPAAATLGISESTLNSALAGKRLSNDTYKRMLLHKQAHEARVSGEDDPEAA